MSVLQMDGSMKNLEKTPGGGLSTIPSPTLKANIYNSKSATKLAILHTLDKGVRVGVKIWLGLVL